MKIKHLLFEDTKLQNVAYVLLGATAIAVCGWIKIPFYPVSFTLHTFAILLIGLTFTPLLALSSVLCYLGIYNPSFIFSPCLGYFVGFALSAYYVAKMRTRCAPWLATLIATMIIWMLGSYYLIPFLGWKTALIKGTLIFIPSDLLKMSLALRLAKGKKYD